MMWLLNVLGDHLKKIIIINKKWVPRCMLYSAFLRSLRDEQNVSNCSWSSPRCKWNTWKEGNYWVPVDQLSKQRITSTTMCDRQRNTVRRILTKSRFYQMVRVTGKAQKKNTDWHTPSFPFLSVLSLVESRQLRRLGLADPVISQADALLYYWRGPHIAIQ